MLALGNSCVFADAAEAPLALWPEPAKVEAFIQDMHDRHGFDKAPLLAMFSAIGPNETVLTAILPPRTPAQKAWRPYRAGFVNARRTTRGAAFWREHHATLARAEQQYGVPAEVIVAIIGVETEYGRNTGRFDILQALASLAFAYPPREAFFRSELEQFLLLARENDTHPAQYRGSFAGALGIPQFMPGSQRRFAIDFDHDGKVDLKGSVDDAIGSVANFLLEHGWQAGQPVAAPLGKTPTDSADWLGKGVEPSIRRTDLQAAGWPEDALPNTEPAALIDLPTPGHTTEYWWGYRNFFVITRYNRSNLYAMSVAQLASAIRQFHQTGKLPEDLSSEGARRNTARHGEKRKTAGQKGKTATHKTPLRRQKKT